jgi:CBS domain-containing protein
VDGRDREDVSVAAFLRAVSAGDAAGTAAAGDVPPPCECLLRGRQARPVDCLLTASRFELAGRRDWVVAARSLGAARDAGHDGGGAGEADAARPFGLLAARSGRGMFRAAGARRALLVEANPAAREAFGIPTGADLAGAGLYGLLAEPAEAERLAAELSSRGSVVDRRLLAARPDGSTRTLSLTVVLAGGDPAGARLEGFVDDVTGDLLSERLREEQLAEAQASSLALAAPVASLARAAVTCGMNSTAREAALLMSRRRETILLVTAPGGEALGVVTDGDLRERLLAPGVSPGTRVRDIMSAPIVSVTGSAPLSEALRVMGEKDIGHLAVRGPAGEVVGILRGKDLVQVHRQALSVMESDIEAASSPAEVGACRANLPGAVRLMAAGGARPSRLAHVLSSVADAAVAKLVQLAAAELGPAPAEFAFLVLGSGGREEQTLGSDQDNAIIHAGEDGEPYFLELGRRVCGWLAEMGVPACPGAFMASTPEWCAPRERWQEYFTRWVREPEGRELLDFNIFFDFRCVAGNPGLARELRASLAVLLADNPPFFLHMARDALSKRLPALFTGGLLRDLLGAGGAELDLKEAMSPLVHFARLYALRHGIPATSTAGRLAGLREAGVISQALHEQIERAWWFLWQLRAGAGADAARAAGRPPGVLDTRTLAEQDRAALRTAASQVVLLHKRISFDFLGSAL